MSTIGKITSNFETISSSSLNKISTSIGKTENTTSFVDKWRVHYKM